MEIKEGYHLFSYLGQKIHFYKQNENEKIALVSLPEGEVADINSITLPGKTIKCIVNASYFERGKSNMDLGRVQSLTFDGRPMGKGEEGFRGWRNTDDKPYFDLVILKDGSIKFGDFNLSGI